MKTAKCLLCLLFIIGNLIFAKPSDRKWIGIIENQYGHSIARIIMIKDDTIWKPLTEEGPAHIIDTNILRMGWNIFFDGKKIGNINNLIIPESKYSPEINTYEIVDTSKIAKIRKNRNLYKSWLGIPEYRPLIMISATNPTSTKLIKGSLLKVEKKRLIKKFRSLIKEVFICDNVAAPGKKYIYRDDDVEIPLVYTIPKLGRIIKMRLSRKLMKCDFSDQEYWSEIWFLLRKDGNITFLDPNLSGQSAIYLMVVDAGDYDNDGKIDIVFSISAYNLGGYILFYNDCKESISAMWHYH